MTLQSSELEELIDDIIDTTPSLCSYESNLRCSICYSYIHTAMMISTCYHTYCSLCIRRSLYFIQRCPTCNKSAISSQLIKNRMIDILVENFITFKKTLSHRLSTLLYIQLPVQHTSIVEEKENVKQKNHDEMLLLNDTLHNTKTKHTLRTLFDTQKKQRHELNVKKIECPVCLIPINESLINMHLDVCLGNTNNQPTHILHPQLHSNDNDVTMHKNISSSSSHLPLPVYNMLKDKQLKQLLRDVNLPQHGDRDAMIRRHREYILMYNAEMDSMKPMSVDDIIRDVMKREQRQTSHRENKKQNQVNLFDAFAHNTNTNGAQSSQRGIISTQTSNNGKRKVYQLFTRSESKQTSSTSNSNTSSSSSLSTKRDHSPSKGNKENIRSSIHTSNNLQRGVSKDTSKKESMVSGNAIDTDVILVDEQEYENVNEKNEAYNEGSNVMLNDKHHHFINTDTMAATDTLHHPDIVMNEDGKPQLSSGDFLHSSVSDTRSSASEMKHNTVQRLDEYADDDEQRDDEIDDMRAPSSKEDMFTYLIAQYRRKYGHGRKKKTEASVDSTSTIDAGSIASTNPAVHFHSEDTSYTHHDTNSLLPTAASKVILRTTHQQHTNVTATADNVASGGNATAVPLNTSSSSSSSLTGMRSNAAGSKWRAIYHDKLKRVFYYNTDTRIGQFQRPAELSSTTGTGNNDDDDDKNDVAIYNHGINPESIIYSVKKIEE